MAPISRLTKATFFLLLPVIPHSLKAADPPRIINHQGRTRSAG